MGRRQILCHIAASRFAESVLHLLVAPARDDTSMHGSLIPERRWVRALTHGSPPSHRSLITVKAGRGLPNAISQKSKPSLRWRLCCGVAPSAALFICLQMYMGRLRRLVRILQGLLTTCVGGRSLAKRSLRKRREGTMLATNISAFRMVDGRAGHNSPACNGRTCGML